jgi:hypothetical protein
LVFLLIEHVLKNCSTHVAKDLPFSLIEKKYRRLDGLLAENWLKTGTSAPATVMKHDPRGAHRATLATHKRYTYHRSEKSPRDVHKYMGSLRSSMRILPKFIVQLKGNTRILTRFYQLRHYSRPHLISINTQRKW